MNLTSRRRIGMKMASLISCCMTGVLSATSALGSDLTLTLDEAVLTIPQYDGDAVQYAGDFSTLVADGHYSYASSTLMFVLDWERLQAEASSVSFSIVGGLSTKKTGKPTVAIGIKSEGMGILVCVSSDGNFKPNLMLLDEDFAASGKFAMTLTTGVGTHILASNGNRIESVSEGDVKNGGAYSYMSIRNFQSSIDSVYVFDEALATDEVQSLSRAAIAATMPDLNIAVPEPTAATFSLLALVLLAKRRRRC